MSFVYEDLSQEAGEKLEAKYNFINPFNQAHVNVRFWAVDKDRDAFLIPLGYNGSAEGPIKREKHVLIWSGKMIYITSYTERKELVEPNVPALVAEEIKAPAEFLADVDKRMQLEEAVKEALITIRSRHFPVPSKPRYKQLSEPIPIEQ